MFFYDTRQSAHNETMGKIFGKGREAIEYQEEMLNSYRFEMKRRKFMLSILNSKEVSDFQQKIVWISMGVREKNLALINETKHGEKILRPFFWTNPIQDLFFKSYVDMTPSKMSLNFRIEVYNSSISFLEDLAEAFYFSGFERISLEPMADFSPRLKIGNPSFSKTFFVPAEILYSEQDLQRGMKGKHLKAKFSINVYETNTLSCRKVPVHTVKYVNQCVL